MNRIIPWVVAASIMAAGLLAGQSQIEQLPKNKPTADHTKFEELKGPFASGPEVTAACLKCHTEASKHFMKTRHWNWYSEIETLATSAEDRKVVGKGGDIINNFCIAVGSNEPRCTSCHAGYGWKDQQFDFASETLVDCLVCHEQTGTYKKFPTDAGHPNYVEKEWPMGSGNKRPPVDLIGAAQSVDLPTAKNCGACHFYGGGGEGVKHGDMDSSLLDAAYELDVHMSAEGGGFNCTVCHTTVDHEIHGPNVTLEARDQHKFRLAGTGGSNLSCEACHTQRPHTVDKERGYDPAKATFENVKLDEHTDRVACQTCHVPHMSPNKATKMWWDWSAAGKKNSAGKPLVEKADVDGESVPIYHGLKGSFIWAKGAPPEYYWYDGHEEQMYIGDSFDVSQPGAATTVSGSFDKLDMSKPVVPINALTGSYGDPKSRIWPFKVHRGIQGYDTVENKLLVPKLFGPKGSGAFWKDFTWAAAFDAGMKYIDKPWSGEFDWIQTEMYWPLTHMVAPAEQALSCTDCHSPEGRLANLNDFYLPGRNRSGQLDAVGIAAVIFAALIVVAHAVVRVVLKTRS